MAGRPKKMAKRVTELEDRALVLKSDVEELVPDQYLEDDYGPDPLGLGQAWENALDATEDAHFALGALGEILRDRAGIEDQEPGDQLDTPAPSDPEPGKPR